MAMIKLTVMVMVKAMVMAKVMVIGVGVLRAWLWLGYC